MIEVKEDGSEKLTSEDLDMINNSLLAVIPVSSRLPYFSLRTSTGQLKIMPIIAEDERTLPAMRLSSAVSSASESDVNQEMEKSTTIGTVWPNPVFPFTDIVSTSSDYGEEVFCCGQRNFTSVPPTFPSSLPNFTPPVVSCPNVQANSVEILVSKNETADKIINANENLTRPSSGQTEASCVNLFSSLDESVPSNQPDHSQCQDKRTEKFLCELQQDTLSLVSSFPVVNSTQIQSQVDLGRTDLSLSPILPTQISGVLNADSSLRDESQGENQTAAEEFPSSLMSLARKVLDALMAEVADSGASQVSETASDVAQSESVPAESGTDNGGIRAEQKSSERTGDGKVERSEPENLPVTCMLHLFPTESECQSVRHISSPTDVQSSVADGNLVPTNSQMVTSPNSSAVNSIAASPSVSRTVISQDVFVTDQIRELKPLNCESFSSRSQLNSPHGSSGSLTPVQKYLAAASQFLDGGKSRNNSCSLPSTQHTVVYGDGHPLVNEDRKPSVDVSFLFPKSRSLPRDLSSPTSHRKLYHHGSRLFNKDEDVFCLPEFSKSVDLEKHSTIESEDKSFGSVCSPEVLFRRPRLRRRPSDGLKRKLFYASDSKVFCDGSGIDRTVKGSESNSDKCLVLKKSDCFVESPSDGCRLPFPPNCSDSNLSLDKHISMQPTQVDESIARSDSQIRMYGNVIKRIQERQECRKLTSPKSPVADQKDANAIAEKSGKHSDENVENESLDVAAAEDIGRLKSSTEISDDPRAEVNASDNCLLSIEGDGVIDLGNGIGRKRCFRTEDVVAAKKRKLIDKNNPSRKIKLRSDLGKRKTGLQEDETSEDLLKSEDLKVNGVFKVKQKKHKIEKRSSDKDDSDRLDGNAAIMPDGNRTVSGDVAVSDVAAGVLRASVDDNDNRLSERMLSSRFCTEISSNVVEMFLENAEPKILTLKKPTLTAGSSLVSHRNSRAIEAASRDLLKPVQKGNLVTVSPSNRSNSLRSQHSSKSDQNPERKCRNYKDFARFDEITPRENLLSKQNRCPSSIADCGRAKTTDVALLSENFKYHGKHKIFNDDKQKGNRHTSVDQKDPAVEEMHGDQRGRDGKRGNTPQKPRHEKPRKEDGNIVSERCVTPISMPSIELNDALLLSCRRGLRNSGQNGGSNPTKTLLEINTNDVFVAAAGRSTVSSKRNGDICSDDICSRSGGLPESHKMCAKQTVIPCKFTEHPAHSKTSSPDRTLRLRSRRNLPRKEDVPFSSSTVSTTSGVSVKAVTSVRDTSHENKPSEVLFESVRTRSRVKSSIGSSVCTACSQQEPCRCSIKSPSTEETVSNQRPCNDRAKGKSIRELLSLEFGSSRAESKLFDEAKFSEKSKKFAYSYFLNSRP